MLPTHRADLAFLALAHYALAALSGLLTVVPGIYAAMGYDLVTGRLGAEQARVPPGAGWTFVAIGVGGVLLAFAYALLMVVAARSIITRRRFRLVVAVALVSLVFLPFGTLLGAATLLTLRRNDVRLLFGRGDARYPS